MRIDNGHLSSISAPDSPSGHPRKQISPQPCQNSPWLGAHPVSRGISCSFPPDFPNANNVEWLGKWLRETVIVNTYFPDLAAITTASPRFLPFLSFPFPSLRDPPSQYAYAFVNYRAIPRKLWCD